MEWLLLQYADAERTLPFLHELGEAVAKAVAKLLDGAAGAEAPVRPIVGALKALARATVKTLSKYDGDYSRLTDIARMTLDCQSLGPRAPPSTSCPTSRRGR